MLDKVSAFAAGIVLKGSDEDHQRQEIDSSAKGATRGDPQLPAGCFGHGPKAEGRLGKS